jgi:hypothetical protein
MVESARPNQGAEHKKARHMARSSQPSAAHRRPTCPLTLSCVVEMLHWQSIGYVCRRDAPLPIDTSVVCWRGPPHLLVRRPGSRALDRSRRLRACAREPRGGTCRTRACVCHFGTPRPGTPRAVHTCLCASFLAAATTSRTLRKSLFAASWGREQGAAAAGSDVQAAGAAAPELL